MTSPLRVAPLAFLLAAALLLQGTAPADCFQSQLDYDVLLKALEATVPLAIPEWTEEDLWAAVLYQVCPEFTGVDNDANGIDALRSLLGSRSAETRYGAFRGLAMIDPRLPDIRGEPLEDVCQFHVLDVPGKPLIHATRAARAEIVLFGTSHPVKDGLRVEAGPAIVVVVTGDEATVSCFRPGEPDQQQTVAPRVEPILRTIVEFGGGYPDLVQFLQQATAQRKLDSRLAFDAIPTEFDGRLSVHEEVAEQEREIEPDETTDAEDDLNDQPSGRWPALFDTARLELGS